MNEIQRTAAQIACDARTFTRAGCFSQAEDMLALGLLRYPGDGALLCLSHELYRSSGRMDKALATAQSIIQFSRDSVQGYVLAIQDLLALDELVKAHEMLGKALIDLPDHPDLLNLSIVLARLSGNFNKSLEVVKRLLELYPDRIGGVSISLIHSNKIVELESYLVGAGSCKGQVLGLSFLKQLRSSWAVLREINKCKIVTPFRYRLWRASHSRPSRKPAIRSPFLTGDLLAPHDFIAFQYWSQGEPPAPIAQNIRKWQRVFESIGIGSYHIFSKESARKWIARFQPAFLRLFDSSYHPAIESDVFRIAFAQGQNSIYVDCDNYVLPSTADVISMAIECQSSVLFFRSGRPRLANGFFLSRAGCPYFCRLADSVHGIELSPLLRKQRFFKIVGPGKYNAIFDDFTQSMPCSVNDSHGEHLLPSLACGSLRLSFVCEEHVTWGRPPYSIEHHQYDHWQQSLRS